MTVDDKNLLTSLLRDLALEITSGNYSDEVSRVADSIVVVQDFLRDGKEAE